MDNDLTLKEAALKLGFVTEVEFDRVVDPAKMVRPYVAQEVKSTNAQPETTQQKREEPTTLKSQKKAEFHH